MDLHSNLAASAVILCQNDSVARGLLQVPSEYESPDMNQATRAEGREVDLLRRALHNHLPGGLARGDTAIAVIFFSLSR